MQQNIDENVSRSAPSTLEQRQKLIAFVLANEDLQSKIFDEFPLRQFKCIPRYNSFLCWYICLRFCFSQIAHHVIHGMSLIQIRVKIRTLEETNKMLHLAKLNESDILPTSQIIYFEDSNVNDEKYKFLQLDQHLLGEIKEGHTLFVKGDPEESVVLSTQNRTYNVVQTETSNSLLLINNMKFFEDIKDQQERGLSIATVSGIFYECLEPNQCKPHLKKLLSLLENSVYKGPEYESEVNEQNLYTFEQLNDTIQSSEVELKDALAKMTVVEINDKLRLLDFEYHFRVLSYMLKLIDENSWPLDEINYQETLETLKNLVPEDILKSLFNKYTEKSKIKNGVQLYSYKEAEVCKFFAEVLLSGAEKFHLNDFLQAWHDSVPEGMVPSEELLHGIAIVDRKSQPNVVFAFPEDRLPEEINARFEELFRVREKWTVPEITPYIERLATDKLDVNALLTKHARASTVQGVKYYSAKHAK